MGFIMEAPEAFWRCIKIVELHHRPLNIMFFFYWSNTKVIPDVLYAWRLKPPSFKILNEELSSTPCGHTYDPHADWDRTYQETKGMFVKGAWMIMLTKP